jgi:hypothetical protein
LLKEGQILLDFSPKAVSEAPEKKNALDSLLLSGKTENRLRFAAMSRTTNLAGMTRAARSLRR